MNTQINNNSNLDKFTKALDACNPEQMQAIQQIEGPMLVIAGPGTGKTQILALRIGKILLETDAKPHNILCLTYTDAGTVAMRKRLEKFIGADAYRVHINTFHSFCNKVIQENMEYFSMHELELVSDLESAELLTHLIDNFGTEHPLKQYVGEIYSSSRRLKSLFNTMKSENWTSKEMSDSIDEYLSSLPEREDYIYKVKSKNNAKGDIKTDKLNKETEKMEILRAAAFEFDNYERMLKNAQRYDYQDMINWVIKAFKANEILLAKYQEEYLYFLVDEYQDTNGSQNAILNQLTDFWDNPNVFVVGDDDQSIFRFQGANLQNIEEFITKYAQDLGVVMLEANYRSTQNILDASKSVIVNNLERLSNNVILSEKLNGVEKNLIAHNKEYGQEHLPVNIVEYLNPLHEQGDIVLQVEAMHLEGKSMDEVAIIYRNHSHITNIMRVFDKRKIPYNARKKTDLLTLPFAQNLINILRYIDVETQLPGSGEYLLFPLMHYEYFNIATRDIATISVNCTKKDEQLQWRSLMASPERMFRLSLQTASAISSLEANLTYWIKEHFNITLQMLFEKILTKGGIFDFILRNDDKVWLLEIVNTLFEFIKDESAKKPRLNLHQFIEMIDVMEKNGISINLQKIVKSENGVNLLTAHSSKGLEFENVFVISAGASQWEKKRSNNSEFCLPDTLAKSLKENKIEEERRLFYVAITRAKKGLQISFPIHDMKGKEITKSIFVSEIESTVGVKPIPISLTDDQLIEYTLQSLEGSPKLDAKAIETAFINDKLKTYKLSVTHLNKYLKCPLTFYFENILQVPTARSPSMGFGNAIHFALDQLFKKMKASESATFPAKHEFYNFFKIGMKNSASHFTQKEYELRLAYANEILPLYYENYIANWRKTIVTEYRPGNVMLGNIPISGALDKVEFLGKDQVNVVDYKTGDPTKIKKKMNRPTKEPLTEDSTFEDKYGGDYWRQIVFYKILLENDKTKTWNMESGEIDFIEKRKSTKFIKEKIVVTFEDYETVTNQIKYTYEGIMSHNFSGCGKKDCTWCKFVRNNYKSDLEIEEE